MMAKDTSDQDLRRWCIEMGVAVQRTVPHEKPIEVAKNIYEWVKGEVSPR
jgi:hypothetical protein